MDIPHVGSCRSSSTVMVNTHSAPPATLLVFKMESVKVSKGPCGKECAGSIAGDELTVHFFCAARAVATGVLLCQFSSEIKCTGASRVWTIKQLNLSVSVMIQKNSRSSLSPCNNFIIPRITESTKYLITDWHRFDWNLQWPGSLSEIPERGRDVYTTNIYHTRATFCDTSHTE